MLISSKSFMDYTSSGLENPLAYALLAAFLGFFFRCLEGDRPEARDLLGREAGPLGDLVDEGRIDDAPSERLGDEFAHRLAARRELTRDGDEHPGSS